VGEDWRPPDELDEYRLVRELGRGATGQVYLAHDQLLDRPVAVKFVPKATDPVARSRVFEEARAIARLQHPNVVAIYRVAELEGSPYLVSEYIRGQTLDQMARPVPWQKALRLAIDLANGLAAAHRGGVLHRDVKPANAIVTEDGRGKLLDFGLARVFYGTEPAVEPPLEPPRERERAHAAVDVTASARPVVASGSDTTGDSFDPGAPDRPLPIATAGPRAAGTPLYMAPELWRGEPATRRTDLYAFGVLLYELIVGTAPHRGLPLAELGEAVQHRDVPRLGEVMPGVDPAFAAIVDRLIEREAAARFTSADALVLALEECSAPPTVLPEGNPYRGLAVFESAHTALFFGRRSEIRELVDRVTNEPLVVIGGDSGTGKSSLCRAGVLPWLVEHGKWARVDFVPGRHPARALARALGTWTGDDTEFDLHESPSTVAREIRRIAEAKKLGLLLFVDQLEELMTLSDPEEAKQVSAILAGLGEHAASVRVLATARSDFLSRLATLPGLRDAMGRALYFLLPLTSERIREAIVRPAAAKGVAFENESLVDLLVEQTEQAPGGLPLLQFTLAELWDARDADAKTIQTASLAALGGVGGALARHADRLIAGLDADEREAARRLLLRLVTADGTRARRTEAELLTEAADPRAHERRALEVLVRGRIVVASDVQQGLYEIAHEALLTSWSTLGDWRRQSVADHAVRVRLEQAATAWDRMGRPRDLLWAARQLRETRDLDRETLAPRETAFLSVSRSAIGRRRLIAFAVAAALIAGIAIVTLRIRARARADLEAIIAEHTDRARLAFAEAKTLGDQLDRARSRAFELYDAHRWPEAETVWSQTEALRASEAARYRAASTSLENALSIAPTRGSLRTSLAELLFSRLQRAERDRDSSLVDELAGRLAAHDIDGRFRTTLDAAATIELDLTPATAQVWIERGARERVEGRSLTVPPGHLVLAVEAPGHAPVRMPLLLARGQTSRVTLALPPIQRVPRGMVYVPAGTFLFGSDDNDDLRRSFLNAAPLHEVRTPAYWIAQHEVTFAEWIEYLDELPADERKLRTPSSITTQNALELIELGPKRWRLVLSPTTHKYTVETGQRLHYEKRDRRTDQDWLKFPVTAISFADARAYAAWLADTKRIPGARLCDEYEWERAARGADGRTFPSGPTLAQDDANIDVTYGREPLAFGPDEVGSHPRSRSVFGVDDLAGNVWEWTRSVAIPETPVYRGGGYYNAQLSSRSVNREPGEPTQRNVLIGIRLCVSASS
jgi:serine/threonine protein kinase/formylglycine-generating enzyme required for sulfatase activity